MGQIATVIVFAIMAGADNFQVACGLGMLPLGRRRKWAIGAAFGICEAVMTLAGLGAGSFLRRYAVGPAALAGQVALLASGVIVIYLALSERDLEKVSNKNWMRFGLPISLSFDNLIAGAGLGASGYAVILSAAVIAIICTAMSIAGLFLGERVRRLLPGKAEALAGIWLVLVAVRSLIH